MATQRPLKEGSVRTYQEKVALGFPDILASEVDADLDTIYAAWNGGVATANLNDASVTEAKLAPDAHLWTAAGGVLTPVNATMPPTFRVAGDNLVWGTRTDKGRLSADVPVAAVYWLYNRTLGGVLDDATLASWGMGFATDSFFIGRAAPSVTGLTTLLRVDNGGRLAVPGPAAGEQSNLVLGNRAQKARLTAYPSFDIFAVSLNAWTDGTWHQDAPGSSSWRLMLRTDASNQAAIEYLAPGGAQTQPLVVQGSDGKTYCTLADRSVSRGMLAAGAAYATGVGVALPINFNSNNVTGAWITVSQLPPVPVLAGQWVLLSSIAGLVYTGGQATNTIYVRYARDGAAIGSWSYNFGSQSAGLMSWPLPIGTLFDSGASAGTHTYTLDVFVVNTQGNVLTRGDQPGSFQALVLS